MTEPPVPAPKADRLDFQPLLAELRSRYPQCFPPEGADPKPLKIGLHKDLLARGLPESLTAQALRGFFEWYVTQGPYRRVLAQGGPRYDLEGHPAGEVTQEQAQQARDMLAGRRPRATPRTPSNPTRPLDVPLTEDNIVPGRLELTLKFTELPRPVQVPAGYQFGLDCDGRRVIVTLRPKLWNKLTQAATDYPQWVAALTGKMGPSEGTGFVLLEPALQVFEKKAKPVTDAQEPTADSPPSPAAEPTKPTLSLKPKPTW